MRKTRWMTRAVAFVLCLAMLAGSGMKLQAAPAGTDEAAYRAVFDAEYYYNTYPDLQEAIGMDTEKLFAHFVNSGIREGRSGREDFNLRAYVQKNPDLMQAFREDLAAYCRHYVELGTAEGRDALFEKEDNGVLGSYSTTYNERESRATNVHVAAGRINGMVIEPGESFSYNKAVLPRTRANGYVSGPSFADGKVVESIGGGICQVSSTLYVAMIRALLPSTERWPHSLPVTYVPQGIDATISGNYKDLKFDNIYARPIVLKATAEDGVLEVSISYYEEEEQK